MNASVRTVYQDELAAEQRRNEQRLAQQWQREKEAELLEKISALAQMPVDRRARARQANHKFGQLVRQRRQQKQTFIDC